MGQVYTVSNSMRAKDRDGNPKVWESQYGTFEVWNVYFQGDDTKYQVNKKEGFGGFSKGQEVYGTTTKNTYGGQFKQEQAPDGVELSRGQSQPQNTQMGSSATQAPTTQSSSTVGGSLEQKVDKILEVVTRLEATFLQPSAGAPAQRGQDVILDDIDDKPVDLSEIPY